MYAHACMQTLSHSEVKYMQFRYVSMKHAIDSITFSIMKMISVPCLEGITKLNKSKIIVVLHELV